MSVRGVSGHLLCAVPQLLDPNFERAVVLMLEHDEEGALGLVLSALLPNRLSVVLEDLDVLWAGPADTQVRKGGPVEPSRGWILHGMPEWDPASTEVLRGVWLTTSLEHVDRSLAVGERGDFVFLLGYAGWGPQQLEGEIAAGSWVAVPAGHSGVVPSSWLFDVEPGDLWGKALAGMGIDPARLVGLPSRETAMH